MIQKAAIKKISYKEKRKRFIIETMKRIADIDGFTVKERIVLIDKRTGEVFK